MMRVLIGWRLAAWLLSALLAGCAATHSAAPPAVPTVEEAVAPERTPLVPEVVFQGPQKASLAAPLSDAPLIDASRQAVQNERALERFFAPWGMKRASLAPAKAFWGVTAFGSKQGYAENLQPYPPERWERVVALQNGPAYPSMAAPAIVTRNTSLRVLPSSRPFFLDPAKAGEGFPFDYFQNSALWLGTPVFVTHVSADDAWFFIETAFSYGWVRREDVALAGKDFRSAYQSRIMAAVLQDDTSLMGAGRYLGQAHIGAIFPVQAAKGSGLTVRVPVRDGDGLAEIGLADIDSFRAELMPLQLTSRKVAALADAMAGQLYGWGGMFENRDCSSTMRDLFLPFGIWLPRNSSQQGREGGRLIPLDGLDAEAKLAAIRSQGVPFASLVWLTGHIGLYLGLDAQGDPLLLHNIWGVRTTRPDGSEGRAVVGRLAISNLRPAEDRPDVSKDGFLSRVKGLTILGADIPSIEK